VRYVTTIAGQEYLVEILDESHVALDGKIYEVDFQAIGDQPVFSLLVNGKSYEAYVYPAGREWQILLQGRSYPSLVEDERERRLRIASGSRVGERAEFHLKAPMPGLVVSMPVNEGEEVQAGDVLIILESMKMQNELRSPRPGKVTRVRVEIGDRVEQHQTMLSVV
jgi:biotin carboxyl carrier protein